jgi:hypothetical protein
MQSADERWRAGCVPARCPAGGARGIGSGSGGGGSGGGGGGGSSSSSGGGFEPS